MSKTFLFISNHIIYLLSFSVKCHSRFRRINLVWKRKARFQAQGFDNKAVTMKLKLCDYECVMTDNVKYLHELFKKNGYDLRIAGGAVRDLLSGNTPKDLDFATTATPDEMREMFNKNNIRLIHSKGESHGTVTPRLNDENFEVTTLRIDKATDGRHAVVQYTKNWYLDASRRDLTVNAMYLDFEGTIHDYFNGMEDLKNHRVVFVGDASSRIKEDFLRILRYFRFYGRISQKPDSHDEQILCAIRENAHGLTNISGERIQTELFKILSGNFAVNLLKTIMSLGIGQYIGLPRKYNFDELDRVSEILRKNIIMEPMTLLCALLRDEEDVHIFKERIKPSAFHRDLAFFIVENRNRRSQEPLRFYQKLILFSKNRGVMKRIIIEYLKYIGEIALQKEFNEWTLPIFPVRGEDVLKNGISRKQDVGVIIRELQSMWVDSNFTMTKEELESHIIQIAADYKRREGSKP